VGTVVAVRTGIAAHEALRLVLDATPILGAETVSPEAALGRVLAAPVDSARELPPADNSAMDGYAVRAADLRGASPARPVELRVVFEVAAGGAARETVAPGQAARVLTGAPIPPGADGVVRQEDTEREGDRLRVRHAAAPGEHVRRAGEDVRPGERVLEAGSVVGAAQVGMLAALGRSAVSVHQRPRVAIVSGGDELVERDADVAGGRIVSSNSYSLAAQCRELGAQPVYLGIARDTPADLERHFRAGLRSDVLVSSAGVSVGDRDYVRGVLEKLGAELVFWGVRIKPGYPLAFAHFPDRSGPLLFGLPGNPVSAMVTFEQFVRPALLRMQGHAALFRRRVRARLGERLEKPPGRLEFVRVALERRGDEWLARRTGSQSSGVLRSMSLAHGLLIFPAEASALGEGELASVQVLDESVFAPGEAGF
jgi:molybdopterin molybdotransferase